MSHFFNLTKQMNLPDTHESDQLDFSSPASILAFTKKLFTQMQTIDQKEPGSSEAKRSEVFRDKIFQRFSLLYYYNHALSQQANNLAATYGECKAALEAQRIALDAKDQAKGELRRIMDAQVAEKDKKVTMLERRQMELSAELVHARIEKAVG